MKYIKRFNENSNIETIESLKIEAKQNLSFLLDDGDWDVQVYESGYRDNSQSYRILIDYAKHDDDDNFLFYPFKIVRDDIMSYLYYMNSKYNMSKEVGVYYTDRNGDDLSDDIKLKKLEKLKGDISYVSLEITIENK